MVLVWLALSVAYFASGMSSQSELHLLAAIFCMLNALYWQQGGVNSKRLEELDKQ